MKKTILPVQPYTLHELGKLYGVCDRTFKKWLLPFVDELGPKVGRYYTVNQVLFIVDMLGLPKNMELY